MDCPLPPTVKWGETEAETRPVSQISFNRNTESTVTLLKAFAQGLGVAQRGLGFWILRGLPTPGTPELPKPSPVIVSTLQLEGSCYTTQTTAAPPSPPQLSGLLCWPWPGAQTPDKRKRLCSLHPTSPGEEQARHALARAGPS